MSKEKGITAFGSDDSLDSQKVAVYVGSYGRKEVAQESVGA